jgi:hypothetical protein
LAAPCAIRPIPRPPRRHPRKLSSTRTLVRSK